MARLKNGSTVGNSEILTEGNLESLLGYLPLDPQDLTWNKVTSKPSTFTPSTHTHPIASVTGLQSELDSKVESYGTNSVMQIAVINAGGSTTGIPNNTLILELE